MKPPERLRGLRLAASFLAFLFILNACASQTTHREAVACESLQVLYVVRHGGHTGIVVSRGDLVKLLPPLARDIGHEGNVEIGWGEERYYQAGTGTVGLALRAALWPNSSVLQVVPFTGPPRSYFPQSEVVEVRVEKAGYAEALAFIAGSFTRTPDGGVARLGPSQYGNGWFYRAEGSFHLFNTCNTWAARAIEKTGYPVSSTLTLTAESLFSQLRDGGSGNACSGGEKRADLARVGLQHDTLLGNEPAHQLRRGDVERGVGDADTLGSPLHASVARDFRCVALLDGDCAPVSHGGVDA